MRARRSRCARNQLIRSIATDGTVSTLPGNATRAGLPAFNPNPDHPYPAFWPTHVSAPLDVVVDGQDRLFVTNRRTNAGIMTVAKDGKTATLSAGSGVAGNADGAPTTAAFRFFTFLGGITDFDGQAFLTGSVSRTRAYPGLAIAADGTLYVADCDNDRIRKVTPAGTVSTWPALAISARSTARPRARNSSRPTPSPWTRRATSTSPTRATTPFARCPPTGRSRRWPAWTS